LPPLPPLSSSKSGAKKVMRCGTKVIPTMEIAAIKNTHRNILNLSR